MISQSSAGTSRARMRGRLNLGASLVLGSLCAAPMSALAATDAAVDSAVTVNEVVITAQKRSEDIKSVPISVSVLSGGALQDQRIANFDDLSRAVPGVAFNAVSGEEGRDNVVIRGVSSTSGASTVGFYLDDVSITIPNLFRDGALEPRLPDIDRIEVLRGPQGTLYGDSSEGGTIRYISQTPNMSSYTGVITADASDTQHGAGNYAASGIVNLPIIRDVFALRASVNYENNSGWINHYDQSGTLTGKGVNSENSLTLHLVGKWTPTPNLTVTPSIFYQKVNDADNAAFYPALGLWNQNKEVAEPSHDSMVLASLSVRQHFAFADLTSVTGIFQRDYYRIEDGTYFNSTAFAEFFLDPIYPQYQPVNDSIIANLPSFVKYDTRYDVFNQELRLSSNDTSWGAKELKWVAGLYYSWQKVHNTDFQRIPGINSTFLSLYGITMEDSLVETYYGGPGVTLFPDDIDESDNRTYQQQQYAAFGQIDYTFLSTWRLGLGARYSLAKEDFVSTEIGFYQIGNISPYYQGASSTAFTPKATLSKDLDADSTVYASAAKGFRLGGPTGPIVYGPTSVCAGDFAAIDQTSQPTHFESDSLWTYELGAKNAFFGHRFTINASGFYTDWTNIQQQIYLPTCGYYFTSNVGDARIYGGEIEAAASLTGHLKLTATASANDATITKTNNPVDVAVGQHLIDVPDATVTAGAVYTASLPDDFILTAIANYAYTGHSYGSYQAGNPNYSNPAYGVVNLSLALTRGRYELSIYAKNALDNRTIIQSPEINTVIEGYTVHPRTIGLTTKVLF